jgi:cytochrome c-type biogenesis protein CcmH/NrfF
MQSKNTFIVLAIGILIGAVIVGTAALVWNHDQPSRSYPLYRTADAPTLPTLPTLDPTVTRVASHFACSCGTCGEKRLDICSCETAQQERAFIQDQLRNGRSEAEAAEALNKKYGGLKS